MTQFLIMVAFGCMVAAGGLLILLIRANQELDAATRVAAESKSRADMYQDMYERAHEQSKELSEENASQWVNLVILRHKVAKMQQGVHR